MVVFAAIFSIALALCAPGVSAYAKANTKLNKEEVFIEKGKMFTLKLEGLKKEFQASSSNTKVVAVQ